MNDDTGHRTEPVQDPRYAAEDPESDEINGYSKIDRYDPVRISRMAGHVRQLYPQARDFEGGAALEDFFHRVGLDPDGHAPSAHPFLQGEGRGVGRPRMDLRPQCRDRRGILHVIVVLVGEKQGRRADSPAFQPSRHARRSIHQNVPAGGRLNQISVCLDEAAGEAIGHGGDEACGASACQTGRERVAGAPPGERFLAAVMPADFLPAARAAAGTT